MPNGDTQDEEQKGGKRAREEERKKKENKVGPVGEKRKICLSLHRAVKFLDKVMFKKISKRNCYF